MPILRAKSPLAVGNVVIMAKEAPPAMAPIQLGSNGKLAPQSTPTSVMLSTDCIIG
jgi:hypothetical protein